MRTHCIQSHSFNISVHFFIGFHRWNDWNIGSSTKSIIKGMRKKSEIKKKTLGLIICTRTIFTLREFIFFKYLILSKKIQKSNIQMRWYFAYFSILMIGFCPWLEGSVYCSNRRKTFWMKLSLCICRNNIIIETNNMSLYLNATASDKISRNE